MHRKLESEIVYFCEVCKLGCSQALCAFRIERIRWLGKECFSGIEFLEQGDLMKFFFHKDIACILYCVYMRRLISKRVTNYSSFSRSEAERQSAHEMNTFHGGGHIRLEQPSFFRNISNVLSDSLSVRRFVAVSLSLRQSLARLQTEQRACKLRRPKDRINLPVHHSSPVGQDTCPLLQIYHITIVKKTTTITNAPPQNGWEIDKARRKTKESGCFRCSSSDVEDRVEK
jgi:hypothetical protein